MILQSYALVGLVGLAAVGLALLAWAALAPRARAHVQPGMHLIRAPAAWKRYRFGFATYALIFVAFDMEMIFMYPWAVVFADIGLTAFLDMLVFIGLLSAGIAYAWSMGGLAWE